MEGKYFATPDYNKLTSELQNSEINSLARKLGLKSEPDKIKCLILVIFVANVILKCFSQPIIVSRRLLTAIIYQRKSQKDRLMIVVKLLLHLIIALLQRYIILITNQE